MSDKIKIDNVTGNKDKDELKGCYFLPTTVAGSYNFYNTNNDSLASNLTSGTSFSFSLGGHSWQITSFVISNSAASGNWSNDNPTITADEDGTFTAQAGGGADSEETASAAVV